MRTVPTFESMLTPGQKAAATKRARALAHARLVRLRDAALRAWATRRVLDLEPRVYVYVWRDQRGIARYVGQGVGNRCHMTLAIAGRIAAGLPVAKFRQVHTNMADGLAAGDTFTPEIVRHNMKRAKASRVERALIAEYGRAHVDPGGTLWNTTPGG